MNTNEIEQSIVRVITDISKDLVEKHIHTNAEWTNAIFTELTKYAYELGINVWSKVNEIDPTLNGWVYDFAMCEGSPPEKVAKIWVALESEWHCDFRQVKYDFYKLVHGRSMLRVMIFQSKEIKSNIGELIQIIAKCEMSQVGDRYLFVVWNDNDGEFTFTSHTHGDYFPVETQSSAFRIL